MANKDIFQDDVKEYRPKKRKQKKSGTFMDNYNLSPAASQGLMSGDRLDYDANDLDNDVMLSTSEILDFSEGTDSWINRH